MNRIALLGIGIFLASSGLVACDDNNDNNGTGGSGGHTGVAGSHGGSTGHAGSGGNGTAGSGGNGAGGSGGGAFTSVAPCTSASDYTTGTTIMFGVGGSLTYDPKCLKVTKGTSVTFSGDFSVHPLHPSANRGITSGNPITVTTSGTSKSFTFDNPGVYAYFCSVHGPADNGTGMEGAIWVE